MALSLAYQKALEAPLLVVLGGAPGVGKSGIAEALSQELGAVYLKIDAIEGPIQASRRLRDSLGPVGYSVAYQLAILNLELGNRCRCRLRQSDPDHTQRVGQRRLGQRRTSGADRNHMLGHRGTPSPCREPPALAPGQGLPNWQDVMRRRIDPWPEAELSLDTSVLSVGQAVREVLDHMTSSGVTPLPQ